MFVEGKPRNKK